MVGDKCARERLELFSERAESGTIVRTFYNGSRPRSPACRATRRHRRASSALQENFLPPPPLRVAGLQGDPAAPHSFLYAPGGRALRLPTLQRDRGGPLRRLVRTRGGRVRPGPPRAW